MKPAAVLQLVGLSGRHRLATVHRQRRSSEAQQRRAVAAETRAVHGAGSRVVTYSFPLRIYPQHYEGDVMGYSIALLEEPDITSK